jgi:outer membrane protein assembly factor BamB
MIRRVLVCLSLLAGAGAVAAGGDSRAASPVPDFTFIHCSDIHVPPGVTRKTGPEGGPLFGSAEVVSQIKTLTTPLELPPYGVTVPAPSFAIATGDLTEFGGLNGWWDDYLKLWQGAPFPVYHQSGNHDSTWACQRYRIRELHGGAYYSFDRNGCHFIGWDSATPQDPRPSFGEEGLRWLREDLKRVKRETPIFLYCHHPIDSGEFASLYERDRLLDLLRPYNLTLLLVGHGHSAQHRVVAGVDQVMGGSTFGAAPGYAVVSVKSGMLRVAYRKAGEATALKPLLERPLNRRSVYPKIEVLEPRDLASVTGDTVRIRARIDRNDITAVRWELDDEKGSPRELRRRGNEWSAELDRQEVEKLAEGCHYLRLTFTGTAAAGKTSTFQRTIRFYLAPSDGRLLWRGAMGGSGKASPVVTEDLVVAGAGDGVLYAFDRARGRPRWKLRTAGEILARPLATSEGFYVGSGDGRFYAVDRNGRKRWAFEVGAPVYSTAVAAGGRVVFAANNGHVYCLEERDGRKVWESDVPQYSIESRPFLGDGVVYYGSWDGYLYAFNLADGTVRWKTQGAGSAASLPGVARYYSPADAGPVAAGGKLWVADRMFRLSVMDAASGRMLEERKDVSSVALSADRTAIYLRGTDGFLRKANLSGRELWSAPAMTNVIPSAPCEDGGRVFSASPTGRIIAFDTRTGRREWEYQATPGLYVFSDPVAHDGMVYVTGMDGSVSALRAGDRFR